MCEVNYSVQKKKTEFTKYTYKNNEQGSQIFIFEIILKDIHSKLSTIRRIKKGNQGNIISSDDSINYKNIDQIKVSVLNSNDLKNQINVKVDLDHSSSYTTYLTSEIYLEFHKNFNGYLECNYNITQN
jgi:hypothetical protein